MHLEDLRKKIKEMNTEPELQKLLFELRTQLKKLYVDKFAGKLKDTSQIKKIKKNIARVLQKLNNLKKK